MINEDLQGLYSRQLLQAQVFNKSFSNYTYRINCYRHWTTDTSHSIEHIDIRDTVTRVRAQLLRIFLSWEDDSHEPV